MDRAKRVGFALNSWKGVGHGFIVVPA